MQSIAYRLALAFAIVAASSGLSAQLPQSGLESVPAATPHKLIAFEVASVHLQKDGQGGPMLFTDSGFSSNAAPLEYLIRYAYNVTRDNTVRGLPAWGARDYYVVSAKVADSDLAEWKTYNSAQRRLVLQQFLSDRFQLSLHSETVERPIYSLLVAEGGPKFQQVTPPEGDTRGFFEAKGIGVTVGHHVTIAGLADMLSRSYFGLDRQVFDNTRLTGNYDFILTFDPPQSANASTGTLPSIFTALKEQLGLKLESSKGPIETLAIDHVQRPSEN